MEQPEKSKGTHNEFDTAQSLQEAQIHHEPDVSETLKVYLQSLGCCSKKKRRRCISQELEKIES